MFVGLSIHNSVPAVLADIPVLVTAKADLIRAKREAARPKDLADLCELGENALCALSR